MEWLRSVDLAEYAPNLRGSGVHGGLIVRKKSLISFKFCNINSNVKIYQHISFQFLMIVSILLIEEKESPFMEFFARVFYVKSIWQYLT